MLSPINMQVMANSVDEVAKINKTIDNNPVAQQISAQKTVNREIDRTMNTITESSHTEKRGIEKEGGKNSNSERTVILRKKKERKEKKENKKGEDINRGNIVDIEI